MKISITEKLSESQKLDIIRLWNAEYPAQLRQSGIASFDEYLSVKSDLRHYLLTDENEILKGWLATFIRDGEKWFAILIDTSEQKKGYGTMLLNKVKEVENELNGWVIDRDNVVKANGEIYLSPIKFYLKIGFKVLNDIRLENETMSAVKIKWKNELFDQKSDDSR